MSPANAEFLHLREKGEADVRRRDTEMRKKGYTHRVTGWVHPVMGSDVQMDWYFKGLPPRKEIEESLRKAGSTSLTDYQAPIEI